MKFFLDSSSLDEIDACLTRGFIRGITTNPTLIRGAAERDPVGYMRRITDVAVRHDAELPISFQVMARDADEMFRQAMLIRDAIDYKDIVIKVPCGWDSLKVIRALVENGIEVNCTACITASQVVLAAGAGARYVSLFYGKMGDAGINAANMLREATKIAEDHGSEIIVGSIRKPYDFQEIIESRTHIVTVPYKYLPALAGHDKTTEAIDSFAANFLPLSTP
jgi:transaldolase